MRPKTTLLLIEQMLPSAILPQRRRQVRPLADLNMLVRTGGQERTEEEFRVLLSAAGFDLISVTATQTAHSLIKGERREDAPDGSGRSGRVIGFL